MPAAVASHQSSPMPSLYDTSQSSTAETTATPASPTIPPQYFRHTHPSSSSQQRQQQQQKPYFHKHYDLPPPPTTTTNRRHQQQHRRGDDDELGGGDDGGYRYRDHHPHPPIRNEQQEQEFLEIDEAEGAIQDREPVAMCYEYEDARLKALMRERARLKEKKRFSSGSAAAAAAAGGGNIPHSQSMVAASEGSEAMDADSGSGRQYGHISNSRRYYVQSEPGVSTTGRVDARQLLASYGGAALASGAGGDEKKDEEPVELVAAAGYRQHYNSTGHSNDNNGRGSPRSNRTRDLARRFEHHSQTRRSRQLLPPAPTVHHQRQQLPSLSSTRAAQDPEARTAVSGRGADDDDRADRLLKGEEHVQKKYLDDRAEIETPAPARVCELKQKLWDVNEALQVPTHGSPSRTPTRTKDLMLLHNAHSDRQRLVQHWSSRQQQEELRQLEHQQHTSAKAAAQIRHRQLQQSQRQQRQARSLSPVRSQSRRSLSPSNRRNTNPAVGMYSPQSYHTSASNNSKSNGSNNLSSMAVLAASSSKFGSRFHRAAERNFRESGGGGALTGRGQRLGPSDGNETPAVSGPYSPDRSSSTAEHSNTNAIRRSDRVQPDASSPPRGSYGGQQAVAVAADPSLISSNGTNSAQAASVAHLLAKLQSIRRENPDEALAQIDAILQAESHSSGGMGVLAEVAAEFQGESEANVHDGKNEAMLEEDDDDEDDDGEDETTVSSITNPTYIHKPASTRGESAKAAGQPRPNALQAYGGVKQKIAETKSRRKGRRSPPPASIRVNTEKKDKQQKQRVVVTDAPVGNGIDTSVAEVSTPEAQKSLNKSDDSKTPVRSNPNNLEHWKQVAAVAAELEAAEAAASANDDPDRSANNTDLVQKIHRWEELSGPGDLLSRVAEGLCPAPDSSPSRRRPHPWDSTIPVSMGRVDVRDTSMEYAVGVETEYSPKYGEQQEENDATGKAHDTSLELSVNEEDLPPSGPASSFDVEGDDAPDDEKVQSVHQNIDRGGGGDKKKKKVFEVSPKLLESPDVVVGNADAEAASLAADRQEYAKNLADDFDSAWVALPSSSFFPGKNDQQRLPRIAASPKDSREAKVLLQRQQSNGRDMEKVARTESTVHKSNRAMNSPTVDDGDVLVLDRTRNNFKRGHISTFTAQADIPPRNKHRYAPPEMTNSYDESMATATTKDTSKAHTINSAGDEDQSQTITRNPSDTRQRRGLRAFLKRRQQNSGLGKTNTASIGASASRGSISSVSKKSPVVRSGSIDLETAYERRGRDMMSPQDRLRSRSLEERRIRNPNIAKKWSRLLRVYEQDGNKG